MDLESHLASYGIRHFDDDSYWEWGRQVLGPTRSGELDKLRRPLTERRATESQRRRFYEYIAHPTVASVVHSLKADAIRVSGEWVAKKLPLAGTILDIGCGIGYLTTYYAAAAPAARVTGWDLSKESVKTAQAGAIQRGLTNVTFQRTDWVREAEHEQFDCVCSTQVLAYVGDEEAALTQLAALLVPGGCLLCVEPFGHYEQAEAFVAGCRAHGLALQAFEFLYYSDLGDRGAYPAMLLQKGGRGIEVDLDAEYARARAYLGVS